jgi:uncharacterized protein involved in exopolysaccharide biosynthesis
MSKENKSEKEQLMAFLLLCLKNWYYFVISMVICVVLAVIYIKVATPVWEIDARVSLTEDDSFMKSGSLSQSKSLISTFGIGNSGQNIEDESKKMASHGYTKKMIENLDLNKVYKQSKSLGLIKKELYDQSPVIVSTDPYVADTLTDLLEFIVDIQKDDVANIKLKFQKKTVAKYKINAFPSELETPYGKFTLSKSNYYDEYEKPFEIKILFSSYNYMAQLYAKILDIDFEKKNSVLINMSIQHKNPVLAKQILNEMIRVYNSKWREDKDIISDKTVDFINTRLKNVEVDLGNVDRNIQTFKNNNKLTDIKADVTYYFEVNAELQPLLIEAETQLKLTDIIFDYVKDENNKFSLIPFSSTTLDRSLSEVISKYNEALLTRNEWHNNSTITTGALQNMDKQIEDQRKNLLQSLANIKKGMQISLAELKNKEKIVDSKISNIPSVEREYANLKREQEIRQAVYLFLVERREETMLKAISLMPKLKVIDDPYRVNIPISPNLKKVALLVLFFGGFLLPVGAIYSSPFIGKYMRNRKK